MTDPSSKTEHEAIAAWRALSADERSNVRVGYQRSDVLTVNVSRAEEIADTAQRALEALASTRDEREDATPEPAVGERWLVNALSPSFTSDEIVEREVAVLSVTYGPDGKVTSIRCQSDDGEQCYPESFIRRLDPT